MAEVKACPSRTIGPGQAERTKRHGSRSFVRCGELDQGQLVEATVRLGFANVIAAFHISRRPCAWLCAALQVVDSRLGLASRARLPQ